MFKCYVKRMSSRSERFNGFWFAIQQYWWWRSYWSSIDGGCWLWFLFSYVEKFHPSLSLSYFIPLGVYMFSQMLIDSSRQVTQPEKKISVIFLIHFIAISRICQNLSLYGGGFALVYVRALRIELNCLADIHWLQGTGAGPQYRLIGFVDQYCQGGYPDMVDKNKSQIPMNQRNSP